jgi:murein L,D-transpeptidase YafK
MGISGKVKYLAAIGVGLALCCRLGMSQDLIAQSTAPRSLTLDTESLFIKALDEIRNNSIDTAITDLEYLVSVNPKFKLAQLVYADLLLSRSRPLTDFGNLPSAPYAEIVALRDEARARWQHHLAAKYKDRIPSAFVRLDQQQKYAIIVDLNQPRLYLFENAAGVPKLVSDFYVSIGKNGYGKLEEGDQKTPVGVYFASGQIAAGKLPDFYGVGAFPINYPNVWDRRNGHTGFGIWLHGTPSNTYSRPPRDSDGCIIVSNQDLNYLASLIDADSTPVILATNIEWITTAEWQRRQKQFSSFLEQWRSDWESQDTDLYLSHYSKEYNGLGKDYQGWVEYKRRVNKSKKFIQVDIKEPSIFHYPDGMNILVVTFDQNYRSDNVQRRFRKRQYWRMEPDGKWRIIYEGSMS